MDFMSTSNPRVLRGNLVAMEDSPIVEHNVGIGYGGEIYGDAVLEWAPFDLSPSSSPRACKYIMGKVGGGWGT